MRSPCVHIIILTAFLVNIFGALPPAQARDSYLPAPGVRVHLSPEFNPPVLKGIKVHTDDPFRFDFILDHGDSVLNSDQLKDESVQLIKYFLATLTIPDKDLWVNLSPYEKDRIIPQSFGLTETGRDVLAEDYMLKQITASLIYPEDNVGKKFWKRIYEEAYKKYGTTDIPVNTFNKVWIVPEKAVIYENAEAGTAYVIESKLKVMLEQDYLALEKHAPTDLPAANQNVGASGLPTTKGLQLKVPQVKNDTINGISALGSGIIREIVIPELTTEVNENKNFAKLRQVYSSLILATWYKKKVKDSILAQVYADQNKLAGVNIDDPQEKQRIYERYLKAFKKGVFNYIKEENDILSQEAMPRKYFSGGVKFGDVAMLVVNKSSPPGILKRAMSALAGIVLSGAAVFSLVGCNLQPSLRPYDQIEVTTIKSDVGLPAAVKVIPQGIYIEGVDNPHNFYLSTVSSQHYPMLLKAGIAEASRMVLEKVKTFPDGDKKISELNALKARLRELQAGHIQISSGLNNKSKKDKTPIEIFGKEGIYVDEEDLRSGAAGLAIIEKLLFQIRIENGVEPHAAAQGAISITSETFGPRVKVDIANFPNRGNVANIWFSSLAKPSKQIQENALRVAAMQELIADEHNNPERIEFLKGLLPDISDRLQWTQEVGGLDGRFDALSTVDPFLPLQKQESIKSERERYKKMALAEIAAEIPETPYGGLDRNAFLTKIDNIIKFGLVRTLNMPKVIRDSIYKERLQFEMGFDDDRPIAIVITDTYDWNGAMFEGSFEGLTFQLQSQGYRVLWAEQSTLEGVVSQIEKFTRNGKKARLFLHQHAAPNELGGFLHFSGVTYPIGGGASVEIKSLEDETVLNISKRLNGLILESYVFGCSSGAERVGGNVADLIAIFTNAPVYAPKTPPTGLKLPDKDHPVVEFYNEMTGAREKVETYVAHPPKTPTTIPTKKPTEKKVGGNESLQSPENGGIDLTPTNMSLQTKNTSGAIVFHLDAGMLRQLQNIGGFVPVVISISPLPAGQAGMSDLKMFLGLKDG
ncbi:MAG: hypothetical protein HQL14_01740 [Candidatus Omnitrophica bacterium]|nr:hypothetical protein [Candidatus Omnitrophota bacterium]